LQLVVTPPHCLRLRRLQLLRHVLHLLPQTLNLLLQTIHLLRQLCLLDCKIIGPLALRRSVGLELVQVFLEGLSATGQHPHAARSTIEQTASSAGSVSIAIGTKETIAASTACTH
jgi:hypothetical protein